MPVESLSERPIFASEENEYLRSSRPPISRMAIVSVALGMISIVVLLNADLMVIPILAAAVGIAAYGMISRDDALSGKNLALTGIGLALLFSVWSITNVTLRNQYLYQVGSQFAAHYLDTIAEGKVLEAFELMQPEAARQVEGTSLEAHYSSLDEMARTSVDTFKSDNTTLKVMARGRQAQWQLQRGVYVGKLRDGAREVSVRMVDNSSPSAGEVQVALSRRVSASVASWHVVGLK